MFIFQVLFLAFFMNPVRNFCVENKTISAPDSCVGSLSLLIYPISQIIVPVCPLSWHVFPRRWKHKRFFVCMCVCRCEKLDYPLSQLVVCAVDRRCIAGRSSAIFRRNSQTRKCKLYRIMVPVRPVNRIVLRTNILTSYLNSGCTCRGFDGEQRSQVLHIAVFDISRGVDKRS